MIGLSMLTRQRVRDYVENNMTGSVRITRGGTNAFDPTTGELAGASGALTIYTGKARIRVVSGSAMSVGEGFIDAVSTLISIPIASPMPQRDDMVTVLDDNDSDTTLAARQFRVTEVEGGSFFGDARRMTCTALAPSRYWSGS